MRRLPSTPRLDWRRKLESIGFLFHTMEGVYWNENACYVFDMAEVDALEEASNELQRLCLAAVDYVVDMEKGQLAPALLLATVSLAAGLINAASMTY